MIDQLTPHQKKALEKIEREFGDEWFFYWDLLPTVRRPLFTCETLEKKGYLESQRDPRYWSPQFKRKAI